MVVVFLLAVFIVVTLAAIYLERMGWLEAVAWAIALVFLVTILWPNTEPRREDWIPLMIGMGLFDIALMFRAGLESEGRRNS